MTKLVDTYKAAIYSDCGLIGIGTPESELISTLGTPGIYTPARKSYPTFVVYSHAEFVLRNGIVERVTLALDRELTDEGAQIDANSTQWPSTPRIESVLAALEDATVAFAKDDRMSGDTQTVYTTDLGVHLCFCEEGMLTRIGLTENHSKS